MIVGEGLQYMQRPCTLVDMSTVRQSTTLKYGLLKFCSIFMDEQNILCSFDLWLQLHVPAAGTLLISTQVLQLIISLQTLLK